LILAVLSGAGAILLLDHSSPECMRPQRKNTGDKNLLALWRRTALKRTNLQLL